MTELFSVLAEQIIFLLSIGLLGLYDLKYRGAPTWMFFPMIISTLFMIAIQVPIWLKQLAYLWIEVNVGLTLMMIILWWLFDTGIGSGDIWAITCFIWMFPMGALFVGIGVSYLLNFLTKRYKKSVPYVTYLAIGAVVAFILSYWGFWLF